MGKVPVRLREVVYTISPFETTVLTGVFKDVPQKLHKYWKEVRGALLCWICILHACFMPGMQMTLPTLAPCMHPTVVQHWRACCCCAEMGGHWAVLRRAHLRHLLVSGTCPALQLRDLRRDRMPP